MALIFFLILFVWAALYKRPNAVDPDSRALSSASVAICVDNTDVNWDDGMTAGTPNSSSLKLASEDEISRSVRLLR